MSLFKSDDLQERQRNASAAKLALLEKFRAAANDPGLAERSAARAKIVKEREARMAERSARPGSFAAARNFSSRASLAALALR